MFLSIAQKRRSIRKFKKEPVEPEKMDVIIEAALRSPSSMGNNPWEFIVVTEPEKVMVLSAAKQHGSTFLKNAPCAIVVCADPEKSTVWIEDCSIASIFIQMAAESIGLNYYLTMRLVILPQALKIVIPPTVSILISAFKDTSLVVIISLYDLLLTTKTRLSDPEWMGYSREAYIFIAILYFLGCFSMANYSRKLEKELSTEEH